MALDYGWCKVNDDFQLAFEDSDFSMKFENTITPLPLDTVMGFSFGVIKRLFTLINTRFKTTADVELMVEKIVALQKAGTPYKVAWQIHSTGGAGDFFEFDGTTGYMMCLCNEIGKLNKPAKGDQTIYRVQRITFQEGNK